MKKFPRVLIVEDEPAIAELIAVNLRHNGFAPIWAEDGDAAQRELDAVLPDIDHGALHSAMQSLAEAITALQFSAQKRWVHYEH